MGKHCLEACVDDVHVRVSGSTLPVGLLSSFLHFVAASEDFYLVFVAFLFVCLFLQTM